MEIQLSLAVFHGSWGEPSGSLVFAAIRLYFCAISQPAMVQTDKDFTKGEKFTIKSMKVMWMVAENCVFFQCYQVVVTL